MEKIICINEIKQTLVQFCHKYDLASACQYL